MTKRKTKSRNRKGGLAQTAKNAASLDKQLHRQLSADGKSQSSAVVETIPPTTLTTTTKTTTTNSLEEVNDPMESVDYGSALFSRIDEDDFDNLYEPSNDDTAQSSNNNDQQLSNDDVAPSANDLQVQEGESFKTPPSTPSALPPSNPNTIERERRKQARQERTQLNKNLRQKTGFNTRILANITKMTKLLYTFGKEKKKNTRKKMSRTIKTLKNRIQRSLTTCDNTFASLNQNLRCSDDIREELEEYNQDMTAYENPTVEAPVTAIQKQNRLQVVLNRDLRKQIQKVDFSIEKFKDICIKMNETYFKSNVVKDLKRLTSQMDKIQSQNNQLHNQKLNLLHQFKKGITKSNKEMMRSITANMTIAKKVLRNFETTQRIIEAYANIKPIHSLEET